MRIVLAVVLSVMTTGAAVAQCTGEAKMTELAGGDGRVEWRSRYRLARGGDPEGRRPPLYVYERSVKNNSRKLVANVYWDGAAYEQKTLMAGEEVCQWTTVTEAPGTEAVDSQLFYDLADTKHPTKVWMPKSGWSKASSSRADATLGSGIQITDASGASQTIVIVSNVTVIDAKPFTTYKFENNTDRHVYFSLGDSKGTGATGTARGCLISLKPHSKSNESSCNVTTTGSFERVQLLDANAKFYAMTSVPVF